MGTDAPLAAEPMLMAVAMDALWRVTTAHLDYVAADGGEGLLQGIQAVWYVSSPDLPLHHSHPLVYLPLGLRTPFASTAAVPPSAAPSALQEQLWHEHYKCLLALFRFVWFRVYALANKPRSMQDA